MNEIAPFSALFRALAARPADSIVLRNAQQSWSIAAIFEEIALLSPQLDDCHVLAVLADNSPAWAIADLAALAKGRTHLPLPLFFSQSQLHHALISSGADLMLTDQPERILSLDLGFTLTGQWQGLSWLRRRCPTVKLPAGCAKISFTSGSSGTPKGVCLAAEGLLATAEALHARLHDLPITRHLCALPLALLLENSAGIYAPLWRGSEIYLPPLAEIGWQGMAGFAPENLQRLLTDCQANSLILVPELLKAWLFHLRSKQQLAPARLTYVAVGGARVTPELLTQARALNIPAYQGYGLTECGSVVSLNRPGDDTDGVGRPLSHLQVHVEQNEVHIRNRCFLGYLHADASSSLTPEFATGDLGEMDDEGHLHLVGRRSNLLITAYGRNIAPEWIESMLLSHPAIAQAIVCGEARPSLCALLVAAPGCDEKDLNAALKRINQDLPDYARLDNWLSCPPFTPFNKQATSNGRPIRQAILHCYAAPIAALYAAKETHHVVL